MERRQMKNIYDFIKRDSVQNAQKVRDDIFKVVDKVASNPEIYSLDKYKLDNDGTFRAFENIVAEFRIEWKKI